MSETKVEVLLFTEEQVLAAGVKANLEDAGDEFEVVGTCASASELMHMGADASPGIILYCPTADAGLGVVQDLREAFPKSAVVLLMRDFTPEMGHQALGMGVRGLVSTTARAETLRECLRLAASGHRWVDNGLNAELMSAHPVALSPRQSQLLSLLLRGLKNKEIATEMGLSVATVKAYLANLFEKVGAKDRFELALFGLKNLTPFHESVEVAPEAVHPPVHSLLSAQRPAVSGNGKAFTPRRRLEDR